MRLILRNTGEIYSTFIYMVIKLQNIKRKEYIKKVNRKRISK